jgi:hypothetical protein
MSSRALWAISLPLALLSWVGLLFATGALNPAFMAAVVGVALLLSLAVTGTTAPVIWIVARQLHLPAVGENPAVALRIAAWLGLWLGVIVALRLARLFDWVIVLTLAAVLGLAETFLQQLTRTRREPERR